MGMHGSKNIIPSTIYIIHTVYLFAHLFSKKSHNIL